MSLCVRRGILLSGYDALGRLFAITEELLKALREKGKLKPVWVQKGSEKLTLELSANFTYLILAHK